MFTVKVHPPSTSLLRPSLTSKILMSLIITLTDQTLLASIFISIKTTPEVGRRQTQPKQTGNLSSLSNSLSIFYNYNGVSLELAL